MTDQMNASDDVPQNRVLVVDDSADNLNLMAGMLEGSYQVKVAKSGERALVLAAAQSHPDIILLDVMMPHMDGTKCVSDSKAIRKPQPYRSSF